jgi:hypothetical protein
MTDQPKRRGRPPGSTLPPEQRKEAVVRARVSDAQAATWDMLGGAEWLRPLLDRERKRMDRQAG